MQEHQKRTISSFLELRDLAPDVPWLPVLQGQELADYVRHVEDYDRAGVDLRVEPIVGVGSVCKRNKSENTGAIFRVLHGFGLRLHGFGVKADALAKFSLWLESADSMAWSYRGRQEDCARWKQGLPRLNLANSQDYAEQWRDRMLYDIANPKSHQLAIGW